MSGVTSRTAEACRFASGDHAAHVATHGSAHGSAHAVTQDDLHFLRHPDPCSDSPYRSVYRDGAGWQARAFKRRIGSVQPSARLAAEVVVCWWRREFGPRWRTYFAYRQTRGWVLFRGEGGWWAEVHVRGVGVVTVGERGGCAVRVDGAGLVRPFGSKRRAARLVHRWAVACFGSRAGLVVRRSWTPTHSAGRGDVLAPV